MKKYFTLLVWLEEKHLNIENLSEEELRSRMAKIRARVRSKGLKHNAQSTEFYQARYWLEIFSSLGTLERGASLKEICHRTGFPLADLKNSLAEMGRKGLVSLDSKTKRYRASKGHLIFDALGKNEFFFKNYIESLRGIQEIAATNFEREDHLYLNSVLSIRSSKMAQFKQEFRELILRFIDAIEDPEGDSLARIVVAFAPHVNTPFKSFSGRA